MKRRLVIANTYYQLIVAIQMKCTLFCDDEVVLLISDHSRNSETVFKKMVGISVFDEIYYVKSKDITSSLTIKNHFQDLFGFALKGYNRFSFYIEEVRNRYFDEIMVFNYERDIIGLYSVLYEYNDQLSISIFEEGILSYNFIIQERFSEKVIKCIRKLRGKKNAIETIKNFYCFYPDFYKGNLKKVLIPRIENNSKCESYIKEIFDVNTKVNYRQKFIFFTSVYDFEGGEPIGEFEVVKRVQEVVGKENLLIKVHPRDDRDVYNKSQFNIDCNSDIPWEAIQISLDFSDKVYLTSTSGSVLAGSLFSDKPVRICYMYNLCKLTNNASAERSVQTIESLIHDKTMCEYFKNVSVINNYKELINENT